MYINPLIAPALILLLGIPLFLRKIPRNSIYGLRTRDTLSSDEKWYSANRIVGAGVVAGASLWLLLVLANGWLHLAMGVLTLIGLALVIAATLISARLVQ